MLRRRVREVSRSERSRGSSLRRGNLETTLALLLPEQIDDRPYVVVTLRYKNKVTLAVVESSERRNKLGFQSSGGLDR